MNGPARTVLLLMMSMLLALMSCGDDGGEPVAPEPDAGPEDVPPPPIENAAGIPGAVAFGIGDPVQWLTAADDGTVWVMTKKGELGTLSGQAFSPRYAFAESTEMIEIVHPPPSITPDGTVVVVEGVLDSDECSDRGSVTWVRKTAGDETSRDLQEAPGFELSVAPNGLVLAPFIEYEWNYYNDPPTCIRAQPQTQKLAAYAENQGLLWTIDLDRPCGPPTIGLGNEIAYFSDRDRTIVAFDYSTAGFGSVEWTASLAETGVVQISDPAMDSDGTLYVTGRAVLAAIDSAFGTIKWEVAVASESRLSGQPVITAGGLILAAGTKPGEAKGNEIWALFGYSRDGELIEVQQMDEEHLHPAPLTQLGVTVMGTGDRLTLAGPPGGPVDLIVWRQSGGPSAFKGFDDTPPLLLDNGTVLLGYDGGKILSATLSSSGLAASPWPRWHGSNRRDGSAP